MTDSTVEVVNFQHKQSLKRRKRTGKRRNMLDRITDDIPTAAVAVGATTSPAWVIVIENINTILALFLASLGIILTSVKIIKVWNRGPNPTAHEIAEEVVKEEEKEKKRREYYKRGKNNE